jgi:phage terminase large subunit|tara:strand:+ start:288 stop:1478 length:1191 start_codon:yes stop_codon:yes gene_type:complete
MKKTKDKFIYTTAIDKIRNLSKRKKVIQGGTSAGKTFGILPILIDRAIKEPNLEISIVSESVPHLRRGCLKDFLKIMELTHRFKTEDFNKTHLKYKFNNGSYIEFFSVDDESKLRGARRNILYINEANNVSYEAYLQLSIRTNMDIYIDYNPTHRFWAHNEILKEDDSELLILTYKDNEALDKEIVKQLETNRDKGKTSNYWFNWWKVYGCGEIGTLEGVIFDSWNEIDKIPSDAKLICYGMDFGFTNDPSTLVGLYKLNDEIILDEVFYRKGLLNSDISNIMKSEGIVGEVFADSSEPKSIMELKRYGHNVKPVTKGRDSILFGINLLQEYKINVTKKSVNLKDELTKYNWKKDKEGNTLNVPIDSHNHLIDASRYAVMMKLGKRTTGTRPFRIG